jgi:enamine deaminase RidA (YjgF/YER057c/UK114 family)
MTSEIKRLGANPRMSEAVVHGATAYLRGFVPVQAKGLSVAEQTRDVLGQIDRVLAEIGSGKDRLLQASIWLSDISRIDEMNAVWDGWVDPAALPVRACVEARLARPGFDVEISVIAAA